MGLVAGLPAGAWAQDYPTRAIEIVVPYAPGGGTDIMVRQIVKVLEEQKLVHGPRDGQQPHRGQRRGREVLRDQPAPDGYTLVAVDAGNWQQELQGNATWNFRKDFTYIARMVTDVNLLIVRKESPHQQPAGVPRGGQGQGQGRALGGRDQRRRRSTTSRTSTSARRRRWTSPTCPSRAAAR